MTGSGTLADPFVIWDVNDLQDVNLDLTAYYELGQDIDASATVGWNGGLGFLPIGRTAPYFQGKFNGRGHIVTGLTVNRPLTDYNGLFGVVDDGAEINNSSLVGVSITGRDYTGGLIGLSVAATLPINYCSVSGQVTGDEWGIGGFIGYASFVPQIDYCHADVTVNAVDVFASGTSEAGGFIGRMQGAGEIKHCYATGSVTGASAYVGGFIGYNTMGSIEECFATGDVVAGDDGWPSSYAGGFVGWNNGNITNCYARGSVTGTGDYIGGFSGVSGTETNCYSTGAVTGVGAAVGGYSGSLDTITDCFWDIETSGTLISFGGTGKTTAEMKDSATFISVGWAFGTIWGMTAACNDGYPCLLDVTPSCSWGVARRLGNILIDQLYFQHYERMVR